MPTSEAEDAYIARVNRAIDVVLNDLCGDLRLERLAAEAGFSPFHFHRIFKSVVGETLSAFVDRVRLERAIRLMRHSPASLTVIAAEAGFSSSSSFSRSFRRRYGVPPSAFDPAVHTDHPISRPERRAPLAEKESFDVILRQLGARTVAYRRVTRPYESGRLEQGLAELQRWVVDAQVEPRAWIGYSWDDPDVVDANHCRYDTAIEIDPDVEVAETFGRLEFAPMLVAEVAIAGSLDLERRALDWLFASWLPGSGYSPAEAPTFEVWAHPPDEIDPLNIDLAIQLPVVHATG